MCFQVLMGDIRNHKVAKDNQSFCFAMIFTKVKCVLSASQRKYCLCASCFIASHHALSPCRLFQTCTKPRRADFSTHQPQFRRCDIASTPTDPAQRVTADPGRDLSSTSLRCSSGSRAPAHRRNPEGQHTAAQLQARGRVRKCVGG